MGKPRITKAKRGKHLEVISPTDGAILQISDTLEVQAIGFAEPEEETTEPETSNGGDAASTSVDGADGAGVRETEGVTEDAGGAVEDEAVREESAGVEEDDGWTFFK